MDTFFQTKIIPPFERAGQNLVNMLTVKTRVKWYLLNYGLLGVYRT